MPELKSKKIFFLINDLILGGAQKNFVRQANYLKNEGFDVHLGVMYDFSHKKDYFSDLILAPDHIHHLSFCGGRDKKRIWQLRQFLRAENISLVYATLDDANLVAKLLALTLPSLRVIVREANVATYKSFKHKLADFLLGWRVTKIMCVSREVLESVASYLPFYRSKMIILENGVSLPLRSRLGEMPNPFVVLLSVGTLTVKKGQRELIEVFARLKNDFCVLKLVGEGVMREELEALIKEKNLSGRVELLGGMTPEALAENYLHADIFILNSFWEGFPNVLLEAMAYGLAVVTTAVSGARDLVEDSKNGFLIPVGDQGKLGERLALLIDDLELRQRLGKAARTKVEEQFLLESHLKKLKAIIESCYGASL